MGAIVRNVVNDQLLRLSYKDPKNIKRFLRNWGGLEGLSEKGDTVATCILTDLKTVSSNIDNALDDRQIDAVRRCVAAGKPVFGICKGVQLMNVAFGGTLNQNIGGHMGVWHSAHVVASGWLSGVYSGSVSVLSYHHQSIRDLAPGFQVDMRAGDGTVEAISNSAKRVYGVQFHPEQMNNETGNRCIRQFVVICTN